MNSTVLLGRFTAQPEIRVTNGGKAVCNFTLACDNPYSKDDTADFIDCSAWGKTGDTIAKYFGKGQRILIRGRLSSRMAELTDKESGAKVKTTKISVMVDEFNFIERKATSADQYDELPPLPEEAPEMSDVSDMASDDDYPFG